MGALLLAVIAAMTPFVAGPDLAYAQSKQTTLYKLSIDGQSADPVTVSAFMPAFVPDGAPDEGGYTVYSNTDDASIDVTAQTSHTGASVEVKAGADEAAAKASTAITGSANVYTVPLQDAGEDTVILVTVTASDNVVMATYMVTVMRGATGSDDTMLSALSLEAGGDEIDIAPEFSSTTRTGYTARVPNSTTRVEVMATPTDEDDGATYAVTSDEDDNVQNNQVDLSAGDNVITVTVTASDKVTTGTYAVTVTRVAGNVSTDTTLTELSLTDGTDAVSLSPRFVSGRAPASGGYTAEVGSGITSVVLTVTHSHVSANSEVKVGATEAAAMEATAESGNSPFTINTLPDGTDTVILVTVTAEDMASKATYKVIVERAAAPDSTVATLSALSVVAGGNDLELTPEFASGTDVYAARVPYSINRATVMATPVNRGATYEVESDNDSNVQNNVVDLDEGANAITITVTAADGSTEGTYTVTVTRAMSGDSRVTTLSMLSLSDGTNAVSLMPEFDPDSAPASGGYMAYVANTITSVTVTAKASHTGATVAVKAGDDEEAAEEATAITVGGSDGNEYTVDSSAGFQAAGDSTVILITVTGADMFASSTYKVTVMRGATGTDVITLSALSLMDAGGNDVEITPDFASGTVAYTANVPYATMMVDVSATPTDARDGATYKVTSDKDSSVQNNQVDLDEGANAITVTVTGADKVTTGATGTYVVTVMRVADNLSTDATLSVLTVNDGTDDLELDPEFVANSTPVEGGYAVEVGATVASVIVTTTAAHTGASVKVRAGADYDSAMEADAISGASPYTVNAEAGFQGQGTDTVILVTVTAADLATTGNHMITVSRDAADTNNELKSLMLNGDAVTLIDSPTDNVHARVIVEVPSVTVMATPRNSMAEVEVTSNKDDDVEDNVVDLAVGINVITITVDPVDAGTGDGTYTIRIRRDLSADASLSSLSLKHMPMDKMEGMAIDLMPMFDSGTMGYSADAGSAEMITVTAKAMHAAAMVSVMVNGTAAMMTDIPMYWDMLGCPAMNDSVRMYDDHDHPDSPDSPYCTTYHMDTMHPGLMGDAKDTVDMTFADYYDVPLMMGSNTISVMVTAEDGMATETYTITVSAAATSDEARLLAMYDANGDEMIDDDELGNAIVDFANEDLSAGDLGTLIILWIGM